MVNRTIAVTLSHDLGTAEARRRIEGALSALQSQFAGKFTQASAVWSDNHADVHVAAMGQAVDASIDVEATLVRIDIRLPWLLAALAQKARALIQKAGDDALKLPPPR